MKKIRIYLLFILTFLFFYSLDLFLKVEKNYNRDNWYHWNKNVSGCKNLRHAILEKTSLEPVTYHTDKSCKVYRGKWYGPYTNTIFYNSSQLDIDHIVPLHWAATHGGIDWSKKKKRIFANDIDNLIPVSKSENRKKGALGLNNYLPPNKNFHCEYIQKFAYIVSKYRLTLREDEHTHFEELNATCS